MEKLRIIWHQFRRDEQWTLVVCAMLLAFLGAYAIAKRRSTPPLPPIFEDAPTVANNAATGNTVSPPAGGMVKIHVAGEVNRPGVLELPANARILDAIRKAGGPTKDGDMNALNLAARVEDGSKIVVAKRAAPGASVESSAAAPDAGESTPSTTNGAPSPSASSGAKQPSGPINVNNASAAQLESLPGVGPKTAALIIEYRQKNGAFRSLRDLDKVKGLGPKKLEKMAPYVVF